MDQLDKLDKIEAKIDKLHDKIDAYNGRIVHLETSTGFIKWGLSLLLTISSTVAIALSRHWR